MQTLDPRDVVTREQLTAALLPYHTLRDPESRAVSVAVATAQYRSVGPPAPDPDGIKLLIDWDVVGEEEIKVLRLYMRAVIQWFVYGVGFCPTAADKMYTYTMIYNALAVWEDERKQYGLKVKLNEQAEMIMKEVIGVVMPRFVPLQRSHLKRLAHPHEYRKAVFELFDAVVPVASNLTAIMTYADKYSPYHPETHTRPPEWRSTAIMCEEMLKGLLSTPRDQTGPSGGFTIPNKLLRASTNDPYFDPNVSRVPAPSPYTVFGEVAMYYDEPLRTETMVDMAVRLGVKHLLPCCVVGPYEVDATVERHREHNVAFDWLWQRACVAYGPYKERLVSYWELYRMLRLCDTPVRKPEWAGEEVERRAELVEKTEVDAPGRGFSVLAKLVKVQGLGKDSNMVRMVLEYIHPDTSEYPGQLSYKKAVRGLSAAVRWQQNAGVANEWMPPYVSSTFSMNPADGRLVFKTYLSTDRRLDLLADLHKKYAAVLGDHREVGIKSVHANALLLNNHQVQQQHLVLSGFKPEMNLPREEWGVSLSDAGELLPCPETI